MRHFFAAAAMTAVVMATGGIAHAQTALSDADIQQAEQLATTIDTDIAALGPNPTEAMVQAVINNDVATAGVSPTVAVAATQAVRVANPNSPVIQTAAVAVATNVLVSTGLSQTAAAAAASAPPPAAIVTATNATGGAGATGSGGKSGGSQVADSGSTGTGSGGSAGTGSAGIGSTGAPTGGSSPGGGSSYR